MSPSAAITREEILAVYARGPEAVVALVTALCARLARATATDSHNSGKPPSTDVTRRGRAPKSLRCRTGRRPGGQPGHRGATLAPRDGGRRRVARARRVRALRARLRGGRSRRPADDERAAPGV